jgi:hypothetical protein
MISHQRKLLGIALGLAVFVFLALGLYRFVVRPTGPSGTAQCALLLESIDESVKLYRGNHGAFPSTLSEAYGGKSPPTCPVTHDAYLYMVVKNVTGGGTMAVIADRTPHQTTHRVIMGGKVSEVPANQFDDFWKQLAARAVKNDGVRGK